MSTAEAQITVSAPSFVHFLKDFYHSPRYEPMRLGQAFCYEFGIFDGHLMGLENHGDCVDYILQHYVERSDEL